MLPKITFFSGILHSIKTGMSYVRAPQRFTPKEYNAYFQPKMAELDLQCGDIIRQLGNQKLNIARLNSLLDDYLDTTVKIKEFSPRTLRGLMSILSAIIMSRCDALSRYKFSILQQTNRVQLQGQALSEVELSYFITVEADYRKTAKQKAKSTRLLFNLLAILQRNFEQVHPKHYLSIVQTLTSDVYSQNRMVKVAHLLQKHAICYLKKMMAKEPNLPNGLEKVFDQKFLCLLSQTYKSYGAQPIEDFNIFYKYVQQKFLGKFFSGVLDTRYLNCNYMYRNLNYDVKNQKGLYYKQMFLERIIQTLLNTSKNVSNFAASRYGYIFCSSIITHYFYMHSKQLKYVEEGSIKYVHKSQLQKKPQLPDVFWAIYRINPQAINHVSYLQNTIRDVYPQRYIPTKGEPVSTIQPFLETQMKLRAESVLAEMGLSFKSETNISGRFVDFLIADNILLEMDGIHHFGLTSMEMTDKCHARNLHLMLKGYKMAIVNIYEYNLARQHDELKELIKAKLSLLQQKDAVLVL